MIFLSNQKHFLHFSYFAKTITGRYSECKGVGRGSEVVYDNLGGGGGVGGSNQKRLGIPDLEEWEKE